MIYIGIDTGVANGALGAIDHNGEYIDSFMIDHKDKHILALVFKNHLLKIIDPKEDAQICMEYVWSLPGNGSASSFQFGRAVGVISAVAELTAPLSFVTPQKWKKHFHLSADKNESLDLARSFWPEAKLLRKKDGNRAEALLMALYWQDMVNGKQNKQKPNPDGL